MAKKNKNFNDLKYNLFLICKKWEDFDVPQEKNYLFKYFKNKKEKIFLKYYLAFDGNCNCFSEHTGIFFDIKEISFFKLKIQMIEKLKKEAYNDFDFDKIVMIEEGKIKKSLKKGKNEI